MKEFTQKFHFAAGLLILLLLVSPSRIFADVLILESNERYEGIVTPAPGKPDSYLFRRAVGGQIEIHKDRIKKVEFEDDATDWMRIGDQYSEKKYFQKALESYEHALKFEPDNATLKERIRLTHEALKREAGIERRQKLAEIDEMLDEIEKKIEDEKFEAAEKALQNTVPKMNPVSKQLERIAELNKKLYRTWGLEREDRIKPKEAAVYYEKYLKLEPTDEEIVNRLMAIWDTMPGKVENLIRAYETQLQLRPDDQKTRKMLADKYVEYAIDKQGEAADTEDAKMKAALLKQANEIYERAISHYAHLYDTGDFKGTSVEKALISTLTSLYTRAKLNQDYERALTYYKRLQQYDPTVKDDEVHKLEYFINVANIDPTNVEKRVDLAMKLRSQNLDSYALKELNRLQRSNPDNPLVRNALRLYANDLVEHGYMLLQTREYQKALALSFRLKDEYFFLEDVVLDAEKIKGISLVEIQKAQDQNSRLATQYKEFGDQNLAEAQSYILAWQDSEKRDSPLISNKNEATRRLKRAVDYYEKALALKSGLNQAELDSVEDNLSTARRLHSRLNQGLRTIRR